jgi:hypothetical protein
MLTSFILTIWDLVFLRNEISSVWIQGVFVIRSTNGIIQGSTEDDTSTITSTYLDVST